MNQAEVVKLKAKDEFRKKWGFIVTDCGQWKVTP
jgi:hypothetical protein